MTEGLKALFSLEGKTALVTGSSSGIGQAQAIGLAEAGALVALHGTSAEKLAESERLVREAGGRCVTIQAALDGDPERCQAIIDEAAEKLGGLDILVNCAGTSRRKRIEDTTPDDYELVTRLNLDSVYWLSKAACAKMRERGGGKVLHVGSLTTFRGLGMLSVYGATKTAMALWAQTMAVEWARYNIQVNCVAPGFIETPLTKQGLFGDPERLKWIMARVPARRPGYPADLVGATVFLCSSASDFVTGQTLAVDGGFLTGGSWEVEPGDETRG